jgi:Flp pilus assembly protein TadD
LFFILPPLLIIPLIFALKFAVLPETLGLYVLGLGGFGHHLPSFIRAYADPALFRSHWFRFTVIPGLLLTVCAVFSFLNLNALVLVTVLWGTWHGAMQIHGFARIYDSKVGSFASRTAWLDAMMCVSWFGFAILVSPIKQFSIVMQYYLSGGALIPPEAFTAVRELWGAGTAVITGLFLYNAYRQWKAGTPPNPVKFLVMGVSFAFWWYSMNGLGSLILGVLMWEIFHDIQYNALVWRFQRQRVDNGSGASVVERALFSPGWKRLLLYAALILAYGSIGVFTSFSDIHSPEKSLLGGQGPQWLLRITLASALLHFYYDGFIWRIRQTSIRQGLGLSPGQASSATGADAAPVKPPRSSVPHGWKWIFFVVPVVWLGGSQYRQRGPSFESQVVNLSQAIPGSWVTHFLAGTYYKGRENFAQAEAQYRLAAEHKPDFAMAHLFLADLVYKRGDLEGAAAEYRRTVELDPSDAGVRKNLGFLYLSLEKPFEAWSEFTAAIALAPEDPELHYGLASALLRQGQWDGAETEAREALRLAPGHSGALNYLGLVAQMRGDRVGARAFYRQALAADSTNASALKNLHDLDTPQRTGS